jgi:signal transduction histidine kinase
VPVDSTAYIGAIPDAGGPFACDSGPMNVTSARSELRRWLSRGALVLGIVGATLAVAGIWLAGAVAGVQVPVGLEAGPGPLYFVGVLAFVAAGTVLAVKRPTDPVGWIQLMLGIIGQIAGVAGLYRIAAFDAAGAVATPWTAWLWDTLWIPGIALVLLLALVFPDGRMPTSRWWPASALLATAVVTLTVAVGLRPGDLTNSPIANPLGMVALAGATPALELAGNLMFAAAALAALAAPIVRYRRASGVTRYQLRWFLGATALIAIAWTIANVLESVGADAAVLAVVRLAPLLALPAATAVAVLRYRLYDIDLIIGRTLLYGGLTAIVGLIYLVIIGGVGALIGVGGGTSLPLTAAATAIAAIAFQPARSRLQRVVNRVVYGQRSNPYEVLASFTQQMAGAYPVGEAPGAMAEAVGDALRLARCDVWLRVEDDLVLAARWPTHEHVPSILLPVAGAPLALPGAGRTYPVHREGHLLGAIGVTPTSGDKLTDGEQRLLRDLAAAAWLVLDNAQLVRELRGSRQRLVAAQDVQRRRIERNLHDGAQQRLLELALTLQLAHQQVDEHGSAPAAGTLAAAELQLRAALAELRDLARGIHPAILTERGLVAAINSLAERAPLPVVVTAEYAGRLDPSIEATAYFVSAETLANVIKHAGASRATIGLTITDGWLQLCITDDGCGGADAAAPGLRGLADRVGALDGRLSIDSAPGAGTSVTASLPCA